MADINADGWLDIFVCNAGSMRNPALRSNQLFINNRDLTFTESADKYGLSDSGYTTHASFFDYDMDGDLDCFKIDNSPVPVNSLGYPKQRDLFADNWNVPDYLKVEEITCTAMITGILLKLPSRLAYMAL